MTALCLLAGYKLYMVGKDNVILYRRQKMPVLWWIQWKQCDWDHFKKDITCSLTFSFGLPFKRLSRSPFWVTMFFSLQIMDGLSWRRNLTQSHICCAAFECWQIFCGCFNTFVDDSLRPCIYKQQHGKKKRPQRGKKGERGKMKGQRNFLTVRLAKKR